MNSPPRLSLSLHNSLSWNVVGEDKAAAATESKARQGHDERRSAIEQSAKEGGSLWIVEDLKFGASLEGGHVLEVGEESRLRVGGGERWRRRVIRIAIRRAGAFEKMGRRRGGGVRGGKDLKHNNNLFGNDSINNGNNAPCQSRSCNRAIKGLSVRLATVPSRGRDNTFLILLNH